MTDLLAARSQMAMSLAFHIIFDPLWLGLCAIPISCGTERHDL
jgi:cytochrome bd-type quinol oxidase subunit 1